MEAGYLDGAVADPGVPVSDQFEVAGCVAGGVVEAESEGGVVGGEDELRGVGEVRGPRGGDAAEVEGEAAGVEADAGFEE